MSKHIITKRGVQAYYFYYLNRTALMLSKKKVQKKELDKIRKIDCLGFVKIVLFYTLDKVEQHFAAAQLDECYVDGLWVPVEWEF